MRYKRNWAYEQMAEVYFVDGTRESCLSQTDNKGRIAFIELNGKQYAPDQFGELKISSVHFMTPALLEIASPIEVLVGVYRELGFTISEGDTKQKVATREGIAKEIHKRGINIHEVM